MNMNWVTIQKKIKLMTEENKIILDALECLKKDIQYAWESGYQQINNNRGYNSEQVDELILKIKNDNKRN